MRRLGFKVASFPGLPTVQVFDCETGMRRLGSKALIHNKCTHAKPQLGQLVHRAWLRHEAGRLAVRYKGHMRGVPIIVG